jgi:hypothetical protein
MHVVFIFLSFSLNRAHHTRHRHRERGAHPVASGDAQCFHKLSSDPNTPRSLEFPRLFIGRSSPFFAVSGLSEVRRFRREGSSHNFVLRRPQRIGDDSVGKPGQHENKRGKSPFAHEPEASSKQQRDPPERAKKDQPVAGQ